jgi:hypothetical protein
MAQSTCATWPSSKIVDALVGDNDTYGILRLKLAGCLIAHLQDTHHSCNLDTFLSRTDIAYLSHVGGVLLSTITNHEFVSDLYNVCQGVNVST